MTFVRSLLRFIFFGAAIVGAAAGLYTYADAATPKQSLLYSVDRAFEYGETMVTPFSGSEALASMHLRHAQERLDEMRIVLGAGSDPVSSLPAVLVAVAHAQEVGERSYDDETTNIIAMLLVDYEASLRGAFALLQETADPALLSTLSSAIASATSHFSDQLRWIAEEAPKGVLRDAIKSEMAVTDRALQFTGAIAEAPAEEVQKAVHDAGNVLPAPRKVAETPKSAEIVRTGGDTVELGEPAKTAQAGHSVPVQGAAPQQAVQGSVPSIIPSLSAVADDEKEEKAPDGSTKIIKGFTTKTKNASIDGDAQEESTAAASTSSAPSVSIKPPAPSSLSNPTTTPPPTNTAPTTTTAPTVNVPDAGPTTSLQNPPPMTMPSITANGTSNTMNMIQNIGGQHTTFPDSFLP